MSRRWRSLLTILSLSLALPVWSAQVADNAEPEQAFLNPVRIRLEGAISTFTHGYMQRQIERARTAGADLVIVDINSPGGDAQASLDIAHDLAQIDWAKTVAYVDRMAMSGGAFVALGTDEIVMRPEAKIGDAGPLVLGEDSLFRHAPEKIVSFLAAEVRGVAEQKGHPPALAEAMVDKDLTVFFYTNTQTGVTRCMTEAEVNDRNDGADWDKGKQVFGSGNDRFLTMSGKLALETELAAANVIGFEEFKNRYGLTDDPPIYEYTWVDSVVDVLNFPVVTGLLLVLGLVFLFVELYIPGFGIFGIMSGACFLLFFWSRFLGGTADWLELILFVGGVLCVAIELFLLPGFGVFGVSGILLMLAGLTMAISPSFSKFTDGFSIMAESSATVAGSVFAFLIIGAILSRYLGTLPFFKRMMLHPPAEAAEFESTVALASPAFDDRSALLGAEGFARTQLRPAGKAKLGDEDYDVVAEGAFIPQGKPVRVILVQGNRVIVRQID